ncbi:Putative nucleotidyl transferase [Acidilobus saccharovorans 345-15]|uniref:Putative nucleotidyl transferase n=1 Tax=Acidilobus saccharovorans (strain DSM 16705 / JCM 18335 / VKM B-2471 / 345-15) TaxID=666510 RepID=D9Q2F8_ACIS3|nr:bifunctional sugar-1-phosphate nucleotidylyltransferase/acetyltransferase [Acidilobus saccharovorans]ADL19496.1 Putative nucleotidyl transferase [Acidilobus saccharovorans 345-15]
MKLVILAAGKGTRLQPLTETRPKPLLPILGEPLLCRHLRLFANHISPDEVIIVTSYMKDVISNAITKCAGNLNFKISFVDQGEERGTGDAIRVAMEFGGPGKYLIVYGDLFLSERAYDVISSMRPYTVLTAKAKEPWNYGVVKISEGKLTGVVEKPPKEEVKSDLVYSGALSVDYDFIEYLRRIRPSPRGEFEVTDAINVLASKNDVNTVSIDVDDWLDVGRPWDYLLANRRALRELKGQIVKGEIHSTAVIEGPVYIGEGSEVAPYTVIEGPVYIGNNVKVGPSTHIRPETVLLDGSKAGYAVELKGSVLMEYARAPHFNYVGDSVIGEDVNLGAGTITANLRFDHNSIKMSVKDQLVDTGLQKLGAIMGGHSQTGINVSLMPGVKVGSYAIIYPGCVVRRDVKSREVFRC